MTLQKPRLPQKEMLDRLRALCQKDERLDSGFLYGSFTRGEGDPFSDIEAVLYFDDELLPEVDRLAWGEEIAPVAHTFVNDHGIQTYIFEGLVRGEIHFDPVPMIASLPQRVGSVRFPTLESALICDKHGRLTPVLSQLVGPPPNQDSAEMVEYLLNATLDWGLFGVTVWARGEYGRSMEILHILHRQLLHLARISEGCTDNWLTPSKSLEQDLSPTAYRRFVGCTANLNASALWAAYDSALIWAAEMLAPLCRRHSVAYPDELLKRTRGMLSEHALS